jgi:hypothetical protein
MHIVPLTQRNEINQRVGQLVLAWRTGAELFRLEVGFQGGAMELDVFWHPEIQLWAATQQLDTRYWFGFGTQRPEALMGIACEINIPLQGINRRVAGLLGHDDQGQVLLLHTGKVGGGRPGIGKSAFLKWYAGRPLATVDWPDGRRDIAIPIGRLGDAALLGQISDFVRLVLDFKGQAVEKHA